MLACIALAGSLYIHILHNEEAGVIVNNSTEWERLIPVDGTMITRDTDHGDSDTYRVFFYQLNGNLRNVWLAQDKFPKWSPVEFLESCPRENQ